MRTLLAGSLIFIVVIGFATLAYTSYYDGYASGFETGYSQGYYTGYGQQREAECNEDDIKYECCYNEDLINNQSIASSIDTIELKNPTFEEAKDFIIKDPTNKNRWIEDVHECRHFATDVCNNARDAGLNCAFVLLCYDHGQHAVVAFNTTNKGLVYIEPQTDAVIHPEIGGRYEGKEIKDILIAW